MRPHILTAVGLSALALIAASAFASGASATKSPVMQGSGPKAGHIGTLPQRVCYDQGTDDTGLGIVSQNFEASFDAYDSQGADDFIVSKRCKVKTLLVYDTYFNGSGLADSFNIAVYKDKGGKPGPVIKQWDNNPYDSGFTTEWLPPTDLPWVIRPNRKFWVTFQANMNFSSGGEWGWNTNSAAIGAAAVWRNPGDGFSTGCTAYADLQTCIPGQGADFAFTIFGRS